MIRLSLGCAFKWWPTKWSSGFAQAGSGGGGALKSHKTVHLAAACSRLGCRLIPLGLAPPDLPHDTAFSRMGRIPPPARIGFEHAPLASWHSLRCQRCAGSSPIYTRSHMDPRTRSHMEFTECEFSHSVFAMGGAGAPSREQGAGVHGC